MLTLQEQQQIFKEALRAAWKLSQRPRMTADEITFVETVIDVERGAADLADFVSMLPRFLEHLGV